MKLRQSIYRLFVNLKQRTSRLFCMIIVCLATLFGLNPSVNAAIWFVDGSVVDCDNQGNSWTNAFKYLQDALNNPFLVAGDQIWVAATDPSNPYRPDQDCDNPGGTNNQGLSFEMIAAVAVYGGFAGGEPNLEDRDIVANETILSGEIGTASHGDNSNHVVSFDSLTGSPAVLDGFTVSDGDNTDFGGGIIVDTTADAIIRNCILRDNNALVGGGLGVTNTSGGDEVEVRNCLFEDNSGVFGGGIGGKSAPGDINVINCYFSANNAAFGGGVYSNTGPYTIINTTFTENSAFTPNGTADGGAAFFSFEVDVLFINSLFLFNTSTDDGGAVYIDGVDAEVDFINCTFSKNDTGDFGSGGGIVARSSSTTTITNCILWGNTDGDGNTDLEEEQLLRVTPATVIVTYTCIEGLDTYSPGAGNIGDNPDFVDEDGSNSAAFDSEDNFRLYYSSPCLDAADNDAVPCDEFDVDEDGSNCINDPNGKTPDLDLGDRIFDDDVVDMGAYESVPCPADIDGPDGVPGNPVPDCVVGVHDLLFLIGVWGDCPSQGDCPADLDGPDGVPGDPVPDGVVGVHDLLFLIGVWGPCPCAPLAEVLSLQEELADACLTMDDWDEFANVMTDPESSQEDKDRYNCWMIHLLDHCNNCTCTHKSECPNPNPFN